MRRALVIATIALLALAPSRALACPFMPPPGFALYEDGSWRAADGTTGCLPGWACED